MIIVMSSAATEEQIESVIKRIEEKGLEANVSRGTERTVIGAIGDERSLDPELLESLPGVEQALHIVKPYKIVAREWHKEDTVIDIKGNLIGGKQIQIISGPCSVETPEQMEKSAKAVKAAGVRLMRGGAFKPRTSPYTFQGTGVEGLEMFRKAADKEGLPIVTELMDARQLDTFMKERGIRTFETYYRNVLDVTAIPVLKKETHLPVIVDPSHAGGKAWMVAALSRAAIAAGADGLLVEMHPNPCEAWCDADQAINPQELITLMGELRGIAKVIGREIL
ncbi:MAG: 3-deoxy-7-phosphoheptulonate synthase [Methylophilaceae bacterium]|nr:3-deoxy-7-phosphoheptulonate synthase [Methylophilaceae bacterium]